MLRFAFRLLGELALQYMLGRSKGVERQFRLDCSNCGVFVCYRPKAVTSSIDIRTVLYVLPGALVRLLCISRAEAPNTNPRQLQADESGAVVHSLAATSSAPATATK